MERVPTPIHLGKKENDFTTKFGMTKMILVATETDLTIVMT